MRASLLNSYSSFGKYLPNDSKPQSPDKASLGTISLKQNFVHERPFVNCKFDIQGNRIYLLDTAGSLIHVNLTDSSFSTLKSQKVKDFTIDGNNSLSLLYVTPKSELYRVSFENKKPVKIMNLNMSKIIAFERNYLRQMLLALDYKLLFLCDLTRGGTSRIQSLKAGHNEVFTNASFASNNRYIIISIKNIEIRIVEIMNLKTVHSIRLPFVVENLKIEVSYDSKRIAIYGDCNIIFFINIDENSKISEQFTYELIEIPFLKTIPQLKYTYQNDFIFLGNDQILYAVAFEDLEKAVPIFNKEYHVRMMGFDISLDCMKIAVVSNRTIMQMKFPKGLKKFVERTEEYKSIDYRKNGFQSAMESEREVQHVPEIKEENEEEENREAKVSIKDKNYQYEDEDESEQEQENNNSAIDLRGISREPSSLPQIPLTFPSNPPSVHQNISSLNLPPTKKHQLNYIFNHLSTLYPNVSFGHQPNIISFLIFLTDNYRISAQNTLSILDSVFKGLSLQIDKLEHYGVILCPEIKAIIEKRFDKDFNIFFKENLCNLCIRYLQETEWTQMINWILSDEALGKSETLPLLFVSILNEILQLIHSRGQQEWELLIYPGEGVHKSLTFSQIQHRLNEIKNDEKYRALFFKRKISQYVKNESVERNANPATNQEAGELQEAEKLQRLIVRQEEIKRALSKLQRESA